MTATFYDILGEIAKELRIEVHTELSAAVSRVAKRAGTAGGVQKYRRCHARSRGAAELTMPQQNRA